MMHIDEYRSYDMTGLMELLAAGDVAADELYEVARAAIEDVDANLNAVADGPWRSPLTFDTDGPFAGVPFVVKDLVSHPRGIPMRLGSRLTGKGLAMDDDTDLMRRFRAAGLATAALSTTPEMGFNASAEALIYGPTSNPWDPTRSAGGSSGGTAALVAARAVPAGSGSDGAGSIRIPAAACGVVGLKPSRGRIPAGPDAQELVFGLATEFALTRTVRDTAALLDAVSGPTPGDRLQVAPPTRPFSDEVGIAPGELRIAVHADAWSGSPVDAEVRATVERVASELEALGHHLDWASPVFDWDALFSTHVTSWSVAMAEAVTGISEATGLTVDEDTLERVSLATARHGERLSALELAATASTTNEISRSVGRFFTDFDVLVTPTVNTPAWPLGALDQNASGVGPEDWLDRIFDLCSFAPLFNVTGTPAVSLPLGATDAGLPIGVQLAADMGDEPTLFRLAAQLETALPWGERLPAVRAGS